MTWRVDAEGKPPRVCETETAALALQAELMGGPGGPRYVVVWWQGPGDPWKAPQATPKAPQGARGGRSGTPGLLGPFQALTAADTRADG